MKKLSERTVERIDKLERLSEELERNPMVIEIRRIEAEQNAAKREEAVSRILELEEELQSVVNSEEVAGLTKEVDEIQAKERELSAKLMQARAKALTRKNSLESRIRREGDSLMNSCHPDIDSGIEFFNKELEKLRADGRTSIQRVKGTRNLFTEKKSTVIETNRPALLEAIRYCQDAIQQLTKMKLEAGFDAVRVESLKFGIPDPSRYTAVEGEREFKSMGPPMVQQQPGVLERLGIR